MSHLPPAPPLDEYCDIPYIPSGDSHLQSFDLYVPNANRLSSGLPPLICFVHGGAWRSEDKSEHADLARRLVAWTSFPVAVVNYRLTTSSSPHKHPTHAEDLLQFLHFILQWEGPVGTAKPYNPSSLYILGHSCSAHMLTSIYLAPSDSSPSPLSLRPSPDLLTSTLGIVLSEGIYDIDLLLTSFPTYKDWFIAAAFGDLPNYSAFDTTSYRLWEGGQHIHWLIIHSTGDTLVDIIQSKNIYHHIHSVLAHSTSKGQVFSNWTLAAEHNQIFKEEEYSNIVSQFVTRSSS